MDSSLFLCGEGRGVSSGRPDRETFQRRRAFAPQKMVIYERTPRPRDITMSPRSRSTKNAAGAKLVRDLAKH